MITAEIAAFKLLVTAQMGRGDWKASPSLLPPPAFCGNTDLLLLQGLEMTAGKSQEETAEKRRNEGERAPP